MLKQIKTLSINDVTVFRLHSKMQSMHSIIFGKHKQNIFIYLLNFFRIHYKKDIKGKKLILPNKHS